MSKAQHIQHIVPRTWSTKQTTHKTRSTFGEWCVSVSMQAHIACNCLAIHEIPMFCNLKTSQGSVLGRIQGKKTPLAVSAGSWLKGGKTSNSAAACASETGLSRQTCWKHLHTHTFLTSERSRIHANSSQVIFSFCVSPLQQGKGQSATVQAIDKQRSMCHTLWRSRPWLTCYGEVGPG